ncbi:unnamed protein product [Trichogramma brassicae]|uniref:Uncharacterized protein n=1 Tax=Trichogramma brassicae TaxID=86971 RepID=A0A6H5HY63_9HYME|nr:unnamed protein product [Trichogramma brassicae]
MVIGHITYSERYARTKTSQKKGTHARHISRLCVQRRIHYSLGASARSDLLLDHFQRRSRRSSRKVCCVYVFIIYLIQFSHRHTVRVNDALRASDYVWSARQCESPRVMWRAASQRLARGDRKSNRSLIGAEAQPHMGSQQKLHERARADRRNLSFYIEFKIEGQGLGQIFIHAIHKVVQSCLNKQKLSSKSRGSTNTYNARQVMMNRSDIRADRCCAAFKDLRVSHTIYNAVREELTTFVIVYRPPSIIIVGVITKSDLVILLALHTLYSRCSDSLGATLVVSYLPYTQNAICCRPSLFFSFSLLALDFITRAYIDRNDDNDHRPTRQLYIISMCQACRYINKCWTVYSTYYTRLDSILYVSIMYISRRNICSRVSREPARDRQHRLSASMWNYLFDHLGLRSLYVPKGKKLTRSRVVQSRRSYHDGMCIVLKGRDPPNSRRHTHESLRLVQQQRQEEIVRPARIYPPTAQEAVCSSQSRSYTRCRRELLRSSNSSRRRRRRRRKRGKRRRSRRGGGGGGAGRVYDYCAAYTGFSPVHRNRNRCIIRRAEPEPCIHTKDRDLAGLDECKCFTERRVQANNKWQTKDGPKNPLMIDLKGPEMLLCVRSAAIVTRGITKFQNKKKAPRSEKRLRILTNIKNFAYAKGVNEIGRTRRGVARRSRCWPICILARRVLYTLP